MSHPFLKRLLLGFITGVMIFLGFQGGLALTNNSGILSILIAVFIGAATRGIGSYFIKTAQQKNASL
ncbi:hypothetical protein [Halobacillus sp. Marseille-Q1614]|uniref:hypothetical protein n=1 Tax=Halobacillus sp. Marseille-Q1614 TaxID=2709134 RepID=UPI00156E2E6D|nr:hypothetical protein [Halobacillus sp. Marseille-Q1614]